MPAPARRDALGYFTDGRGNLRIMATLGTVGATGQDSRRIAWFYRPQGSRTWERLGETDRLTDDGFRPVAVDPERNLAYGFRKHHGRQALYTMALDGTGALSLLFAHPEVDVDGLVRIGRDRRVVGATFATDRREVAYFDPEIERLKTALARALPGNPGIWVIDSSLDGRRLLLEASKDRDPGVTYILDRDTNRLQTFLVTHPALEGLQLAEMRPVTYRAADGTAIPAYLTLPPGKASAKGLPAIVLPHGGPSARDEWGFDWLPQYFAARGYAVLQPNFRGSAGYGEEWLQVNGFQSWRTAIGDVADAGRWLVAEGIADPKRLAIVGWSYGGYAALQSAVTDPDLFRAVVAIAPVTDLALLIEERRGWSDRAITRDFIGTGPHLREGSPAQNADRIRVPVLMFHGTHDRNVGVGQSRLMASRLQRAGVPHELVIFDRLDHQLPDSDVRARLLRESDAFLQRAFGSSATASAN
jgi:dipeptidyl aminopeptidase/acylaminoacyl peptidase